MHGVHIGAERGRPVRINAVWGSSVDAMSTSGRIQMLLGVAAGVAAYLLLIVYNGGRVDLKSAHLSKLVQAWRAEQPSRPEGS